MNQLNLAFDLHTSVRQMTKPSGYKGLYGFHKYWGKKPAETVSFLVEQLSERGDVVLDPFLGSGAIAREASARGRRVIAGDLNPVAIELASLMVDPPSAAETQHALREIERLTRPEIEESYPLPGGAVATHYLWDGEDLRQVWSKGCTGTKRVEYPPTALDLEAIDRFADYTSEHLRPLRTFRNSRINSPGTLQWCDLFTGRALRNLELLRNAILQIPNDHVRQTLLLVLTAASGQMSRMVFAIARRGKSSGINAGDRIEVGSWVIGFWRPQLHFEVNVWNCFENKSRALLRGLYKGADTDSRARMSTRTSDVLNGRADVGLVNMDASELIATLPRGSVDLVVTDPPHSDRIPYLELSEIWNAILDRSPTFDQEIGVSNARERGHTPEQYAARMESVFALTGKALAPTGCAAVMFNSRSAEEWSDLISAAGAGNLTYTGCFPMAYSAGSVVQDNRPGALKHDYVLLFVPSGSASRRRTLVERFQLIPHWSEDTPTMGAN